MRTSGEVLKDFESLRKALFNEEISHLAFMRDGKPEILYTQKYVDKLEQEIERLNKALLDIQIILVKKQKVKGMCEQFLNVQEQCCLDIVNKAIGSDSNE